MLLFVSCFFNVFQHVGCNVRLGLVRRDPRSLSQHWGHLEKYLDIPSGSSECPFDLVLVDLNFRLI